MNVFIVAAWWWLSTFVRCYSIQSFTADGQWKKPTNSNDECKRFMCTPSGLAWTANYPSRFYDNYTACDLLVKRGITQITFHGDSYMRQIYAAMLISLKGDYRYGSTADPEKTPQCEYRIQFLEKKCNTHALDHSGLVCGGKIHLDPLLQGFHSLNHCSSKKGSLVLWSFGNYKLTKHGRQGVNNATAYQEFFQRDICPVLRQKQNDPDFNVGAVNGLCSVWWVSTHYRRRHFFEDERIEQVRDYNYKMRAFFDHPSKPCGSVNYVDVYNMTESLGMGHAGDADAMTYDGVHWGIEANLVKAQIILNAILSS